MISIRHLRKEYETVTPLQDVSVEINRGDVISVIGPSGTGKSTLLRCINLLETPTSGQIFIDGEEITARGCKVHLIRRKMGMVFQSFNLFSHMNIAENVMAGQVTLLGRSRQEAYDRAMTQLRAVGLGDKALAYPDELSGGQKQRAAIARTLAMDPEIVLFDEPTSALDPTMVGEVLSVIRKLADAGLTMMIVTHEMKFARDVSNRVFYMDEGGIYEDGSPEQIFVSPKREKTRQFIQRLKVLEENIDSKDFDFIQSVNNIAEFGKKNMMQEKLIRGAQVIFEELCVQTILPRLGSEPHMRVMLEFASDTGDGQMRVKYNGDFDPVESADTLNRKLIESAAKEIRREAPEEGFPRVMNFTLNA